MRSLFHHRRILLKAESTWLDPVFRDEEDQGYYLQSIVPFTEFEAVAVFRRDVPDDWR